MFTGLIILAISIAIISVVLYYESLWQIQYGVDKTEEGVVMTMTYTPEDSDTSVVPVFNSSGGFGVGVSSHTHDEQNIVVIRSASFKKIIVDDEDFFNDVKPQDKVAVVYASKSKVHKNTGETKDLGQVLMSVKSSNVKFIFKERPEGK